MNTINDKNHFLFAKLTVKFGKTITHLMSRRKRLIKLEAKIRIFVGSTIGFPLT